VLSLHRAVRLGGATLAVAAVIAGGVVVAHDGSAPSPAAAAPTVAHAAARPVGRIAPRPAIAQKPDTHSVVVSAPHGVQVFDRPDGAVVRTLSGQTELGAVQTMLTVGSRPGWWKVALPVRPNTATGWVRASAVQATTIDVRIEIDRAAHRLTLLRNGTVAGRFPVAVGTSATPTPAGRFYVTDNLSTGNPGGAYGPYALGLSGHSDVLFQFGSGDGVLGIHGTDEPASIGHDASHGCVRMRNADITTLRAATPLGAPVLIS
jgi:lipoprotein-anchoring transpeptidase ErfK/SrfK